MRQRTLVSSLVMCLGLALTYLILPEGGSTAIYRAAAIGAGISIAFGLLLEAEADVRRMMRTDFVMLFALFGLTLVEFFFPQEAIGQMVSSDSAQQGVTVLFLGFGGLILGRNLAGAAVPSAARASHVHLSRRNVILLFLAVWFLGFLPMLLAVGFDPSQFIHEMLEPRFSQSWQRGSLGSASTLLGTIGSLLLYLVPVIAGSVLAEGRRYKRMQRLAVLFGLAVTLFFGFAGGTRSVFATYVILLLASYVMFKRRIGWIRVAALSALSAVVLLLAAYYMLQFRNVGLGDYVASGGEESGYRSETLFIDNNLVVVSKLTEAFPQNHEFLGWEIPYRSIIHPIPRALWPGKPERMSIETAEVLGVRGMTISSTFVGEAYMSGGILAVVVTGLFFGWLGGWWNRFGANLQSNVGVVLYVSGFFVAALGMRSMIWATTAAVPTVAVWLYMRANKPRRRLRRHPLAETPRVDGSGRPVRQIRHFGSSR